MIKITLILLSLIAFPRFRAQPTSAVCLFFVSLITLPMLSGQQATNFWFFFDRLRAPLALLTIWISALMLTARNNINNPHLFTKTVARLAMLLILVFFSRTLICFYISFEAALLPTLFLILTWGYQPERIQAGIYLMLYTVTASLPLLIGRLLIHIDAGNASFLSPYWTVPGMVHPVVWWFIMITAFLAKIPIYSLHLWLPKAHVEAPVAGSIILAGVLLKLGGYGILRVADHIQHLNIAILPIISALALYGGLVCALICIRQTDLKALIAYSSVTHMAIVIAAILRNSQWAWHGVLIIMIAHGLVSSALFALCNSCYGVVKTRSLFLTKGLISFSPLISFIWFFSVAANIGAPPSINLQREIMMTIGILHTSITLTVLVGMSLFLRAAYCLHVFVSTQHGGLRPNVSGFLAVPSQTRVCILLHILPAFVLILKTEPFSCWC